MSKWIVPAYSGSAGSLSLGTDDSLDWEMLCCGSLSCAQWDFSIPLWPLPLDANQKYLFSLVMTISLFWGWRNAWKCRTGTSGKFSTARETSYTTSSKSYLDEFRFIDFQRRVLYSLYEFFFFFCKVAKRVHIVRRAIIIGEEDNKAASIWFNHSSFLSIRNSFLFYIGV